MLINANRTKCEALLVLIDLVLDMLFAKRVSAAHIIFLSARSIVIQNMPGGTICYSFFKALQIVKFYLGIRVVNAD